MSLEKRELPVGWRWVQLVEVLSTMETGVRPKGGAIGITEGIPSISAEHMTNFGTFDFSELRYVPFEFYEQMARGHIQIGDSLLVKDGATTGKTCFIDEDFPFDKAVINEHVFICRPNVNIIYPRFLFYWLWGNEAQTAIRLNFQGAAIGGINQRFADNVLVPLPPLTEQKRIAAILTDHFAAVEQARKASEARLEAARALPAAYLREVCESESAAKWPLKRLVDICLSNGQYGTSVKSNHLQKGLPILGMVNIYDGRIRWEKISYVELEKKEQEKFLLKKGDLLFNRTNSAELVGKTAIFDSDKLAVFASYLIRFRIDPKKADPRFVAAYINSKKGRKFIERYMTRAIGQVNISASTMHEMLIPIPDLSIQEQIMDEFENRRIIVDELRAKLSDEYNTIASLPATLLRQAFTGNL